jgi:hypothetical protein
MWSEWLAVLLLLLVVVVMMMQHVACTVFAARPLLGYCSSPACAELLS